MGWQSRRRSLPCRVVDSASARIAAKLKSTSRANSAASATSPSSKSGATRFSSAQIRTRAPPARVSATIPRS